MTIRRREFIGATLALGIASAQEEASRRPPAPPTRKAKVEKLYKAPDMHPNALEAAADGLWIGDQVSERVFRVDWKTGKVLYELQTESHNTSGIAVGGGYLWLGANGGTDRRPPRPTDKPYGELLQADLKTGKTIKAYRPPWGGGMHGVTYMPQTQTLWVTALSLNALSELDPNAGTWVIPEGDVYTFTGTRVWEVIYPDLLIEVHCVERHISSTADTISRHIKSLVVPSLVVVPRAVPIYVSCDLWAGVYICSATPRAMGVSYGWREYAYEAYGGGRQ